MMLIQVSAIDEGRARGVVEGGRSADYFIAVDEILCMLFIRNLQTISLQ